MTAPGLVDIVLSMANIEITTETVQDILNKHAPKWASLSVRAINSSGTDNTLFLLGDDHVLRLPKHEDTARFLVKELDWLPKLSGLPLKVPELEFRSKTSGMVEFEFGIFKWIRGNVARRNAISDPCEAALALSDFLIELHKVDTDNAPPAGEQNNNRGIALRRLSKVVASSIAILADEIDADAAKGLWEQACSAAGPQQFVWLHGDLKADNLIAENGALTGVVDWGLSAVGDPAVDFAAAWSWVEPSSREAFRERGQISESDWQRSKGWALYCSVIALSFYRGRSHEALCDQSRLTLGRLGLLQ